jgi:hypothetical protein
MQVDNYNFVNNYIKPLIPLIKGCMTIQVEIVKIVAAKIFLEYLSQHYLSHSSKFTPKEAYRSVVLAPLMEEIIFRLVVLQFIHVMQNVLNEFDSNDSSAEGDEQNKPSFCVHLRSHFFADPAPQDPKSDKFVINLYPPVIAECLCQAFVRAIYWPQKKWNQYWGNELTVEEEKVQLQQIFRIHVSTFIFAAAHLSNPHTSKASVITQCVWSYFGGVTYGYLIEKYDSLAPSILAHGFNNSLVVAARIYSEFAPYLLLALLANRLACYLLGTTSIDKAIISRVAQIQEFYLSLPERIIHWYKGGSAQVEVIEIA